jgi:hypothetical protein
MNRDVAPFAPPLGRHPVVFDDGSPPAHRPAAVPLWAAAVVAGLTVPVSLVVGGQDEYGFLLVLGFAFGLLLVVALLVVAGLAKLAESRAVGSAGTAVVFGLAAAAVYAVATG